MAKSLALGYADAPADTSGSVFDPQTALALMAPGLVGPDGKVDVQGYQQQRMWQGLMGLAAGLLSKSGPSTTPVGFGQALGAGLGGMLDAQQGYDRGTLGAASAARAFADIGKLGAEQRLMQGQADAAKRMAALAPQLFSDGGSAATPAAIAGVPGNVDQVIGGPGGATTAGGAIDFPTARSLAEKAGFQGDAADKIAAISLAESGGNPNAIGDKNLGGSYGLTQIHEPAHGPVAREAYGNPLRAMQLAFDISKGGSDFSPWTMFKNGGYLKYMPTGGSQPAVSGATAQTSEPTVSIAGQNGRTYNLTQAQADQFYRLGDGEPQQRFLANLSMTRKTPAAAPAASSSASVASQSLPGQIQVNGVKIPRPDIAQKMMLYSAISGVKMPSFVEEAAKMPIDQYKKLFDAQVDINSAGPKAGAEEAARDPYLRGREQFGEEQRRITQGMQPQTIQPGGSVTYPPGSPGAGAYANAGRNGALPAGVTANPDGSVTVRGPSSNEEAFGKSLGELNAKNFMERRQATLDAATSLDTIAEAKRLLNSGIVSGPFADWKLKFDRVLGDNGIAANTEAFVATQGKQVGTIIKMFGSGTGLSNADREYAERIAGGKIDNLEEALRKIMDINERAYRNVINKFNEDASQVPSGLSPYPLAVKMPTATPPAEGAGRSGVTSSGIKWSIK